MITKFHAEMNSRLNSCRSLHHVTTADSSLGFGFRAHDSGFLVFKHIQSLSHHDAASGAIFLVKACALDGP